MQDHSTAKAGSANSVRFGVIAAALGVLACFAASASFIEQPVAAADAEQVATD